MIFLLIVSHNSPPQFLHTPYSRRAEEAARNVQIMKKATQHRNKNQREEGNSSSAKTVGDYKGAIQRPTFPDLSIKMKFKRNPS